MAAARHIALLIAFLVLVALAPMRPAAAQQQDTKSFTFAVIDVQRVIRDAKATETIRPQVEKLKDRYEKDFKEQEEELRAANQDLARQRAILSPEAYAERRRDFQKRATEVQRKVQETKRRLDHALGTAMSEVHNVLREITADVAKERSLTAIFPRTSVILVERQYDITAEVLKRLDQRLPSVTVKVPAKAPQPSDKQ